MEDDTGVKSSIVIGLRENRAKEVGMAGFDLRSASLHLSRIRIQNLCSNFMILWSSLFLLINMHLMVLMACGCFDDTKGAVLVKNLAANEPSAHGLDAYYKQQYPCLSAAAATIKCYSIFHILHPLFCF